MIVTNCNNVATKKETNKNDCADINLHYVYDNRTHRIFNATKTTFYMHCDIIQQQFSKEEIG